MPKKREKRKGLMSLLKPYRGLVVLLIFFTIIGNGINLLIPKIIERGIDSFGTDQFIFKKIILAFLGASLAIFVFTYLQSLIQTYASEKVALDIRKKMSDTISRQAFTFIQKSNPSKLLTNLTSDVDSLKMFVAHAIVSIISSIFIIVGASVLLIDINRKLALLVLTIIPVIAFAFYFVLIKVRVLFKRSREVVDWLNKVINESILGAAIIRVLNAQTQEYNKFLKASAEARDIGVSILTLFAILIPIITFVSNLAILAVLALGGHFVIVDSMTLGEFSAFNAYISMLVFPIIIIGFMSNVIANASVSYERVNRILDIEGTIDKATISQNLGGKVEVCNIYLSYDQKPILKNVGFVVEPGSQVAILGPTAAGKTQLLYLLAGLIDPDSGYIKYDDKPIGEYKKSTFHNQVGMVFQDSILFNMTLRENIGFSDKVTEADLQNAIATAELDEYIKTLPKKLETVVSERGSSLSGGQKQRIMLARALSLNPKVLLLDDFTARVDKKTENRILCDLWKNYPDLTLISVTQKISAIKDFDQIILLMEGEIIASGKHQFLLDTCPEYVQIYNSQKSTSHYELQS